MKFLYRFKFRTQVSIGYFIIICFVFITIMLMMHMLLRESYRKQSSDILETHGNQIAINIDTRIDYFLSYLQLLSTDAALTRDMATERFSHVTNTLDGVTKEFITLNAGRINSIRLYRNGIYSVARNLDEVEDLFVRYLSASATDPNAVLITGTYLNERNEKVFSIFRRIFSSNASRVYYIEMCVYETELYGFFNEEIDGNIIYVLNGDKLMSMNDRQIFSKKLYTNREANIVGIDRSSMGVLPRTVLLESQDHARFKVLIETNSEYLEQSYRVLLVRMLPILLAVFVLSCHFVGWLSTRLHHRLKILQEKIAAISNWQLTENLHIEGQDEFGLLANELDETRKRILNLIEQNNHINELMRIAEMSALRAQINTHFLFNSLSSIRWLSRRGDGETLAKAVDALALFLRYSLAFKENQVELADELKQLEVYVYLQKLRYGSEINVQMDVDDELLTSQTVKLVLQPLVENAIYHARREDNDQLNITIYSYLEGKEYYCLVVEDDGNGISPERLQSIQEDRQETTQSGYGLKNVIDRVRMCSHGGGEVTIESRQNVCTKITIRQRL